MRKVGTVVDHHCALVVHRKCRVVGAGRQVDDGSFLEYTVLVECESCVLQHDGRFKRGYRFHGSNFVLSFGNLRLQESDICAWIRERRLVVVHRSSQRQQVVLSRKFHFLMSVKCSDEFKVGFGQFDAKAKDVARSEGFEVANRVRVS